MNRKKNKSVKPLTDAQRRLVEKHISFAMNLGTKYAGLGNSVGIPKEDLQQEACWGLCIAAKRFKARKGVDFKTFAHDWCVKFIMMAIHGESPFLSYEMEDREDIVDDDEDSPQDSTPGETEAIVQKMLEVLDKRERDVICLIYGLPYIRKVKNSLPKGFCEVARVMKLPSARVHQIYEQAMTKMEWAQRCKGLDN